MKQIKTCSSTQFVILLTILLVGCGNKGPLVPPEVTVVDPAAVEAVADVETDKKEPKK